eukprot:7590752-Pyramimonas_sp.AAC.2
MSGRAEEVPGVQGGERDGQQEGQTPPGAKRPAPGEDEWSRVGATPERADPRQEQTEETEERSDDSR